MLFGRGWASTILLFGLGVLCGMSALALESVLAVVSPPVSATGSTSSISSDHKIKVLVDYFDGSAVTPTIYRIYVTQTSAPSKLSDPVFEIDHSDIPTIKWVGPRSFVISCKGGQIQAYNNYWYAPNGRGSRDDVSVGLDCGTTGYRTSDMN